MPSLTERLQLIVDATTDGATTSFDRLADAARRTGAAASDSASEVASSADRALAAQARQADAAGQLRVANERLNELRNKGNASASQLAAAEEKVESAQRRLALATRDVEAAQKGAADAQDRAAAAAGDNAAGMDDARESGGRFAEQLGGVKEEVVGLVAGASLATFLAESVTGFLNGARAAGQYAHAMNSTVEDASTLIGVLGSVGIETDDLGEILSTFQEAVTNQGDGLSTLGDELKHNNDGTVNWSRSLQDFITHLSKTPDATERNRLALQAFGEEGAMQIGALLNSGKDLEQVFKAMGVPFTQEDYEAAQQFDAAMSDLSTTSGDLSRTVGRVLVPIINDVLQVLGLASDLLTSIPGPIGVAVAAAVLLGFGMRSAGTEGTFLATQLAAASAAMAGFRTAAAETTAASALLSAGLSGAKAGASGLMSALGGVWGAGLIAAGAAYYYASEGADAFKEASAQAAAELAAAEENGADVAKTTEQLARELAREAGMWEGLAASRRGANDAIDEEGGVTDLLDSITGGMLTTIAELLDATGDGELAVQGYQAQIAQAREELDGFAETQAIAQIATASLTELIAAGDTSSQEFADSVKAAAEAQNAEQDATDMLNAALDAYNALTRDAWQHTLDLLGAQLSAEDAQYSYLDALDELNGARDDEKTSVDEVAQAHTAYKEAALDAAGAVADAAVEAARTAGQIVDPITEANIRADAMLGDLREKLNRPGLSDGAKTDLQGLVDTLQAAKDRGDVNAIVTLTGAAEAGGEIDAATEDRDTTVRVESRNGPAVDAYLDSLAEDRLALIRVESRNGPAVQEYLRGLSVQDRLALIRVESRNGPAVDAYLDGLADQYRLAIIQVETRGGPAVDAYLDGLADQRRVAVIDASRPGAGAPRSPVGAFYGAPAVTGLRSSGDVIIQSLTVQPQVDGGGRLTAQGAATAGREYVAAIRAYERQNGTGWRRTP